MLSICIHTHVHELKKKNHFRYLSLPYKQESCIFGIVSICTRDRECTWNPIASPHSIRKNLVQYIRGNMARVPPPQFCSENSSYSSSVFHDLTQPQPKICHKPACGLKTLILHGRKIIDGDLLRTTKSCHTYTKKNIHIGISWNNSEKSDHNCLLFVFLAFMGLGCFC